MIFELFYRDICNLGLKLKQVKNKDIVIQKSDKGNSVVIINKTDYLNKIENLLNDIKNQFHE